MLLPNRGHAVQFLVVIFFNGHGRSVTNFSASKGLDLEGSFKFAVRMSFAAEWSKRHCGGSVVILYIQLHPVPLLAFQGTFKVGSSMQRKPGRF